MTYNYFNELCRSFKKRAVTEGGTAKEASCLGRRAMEKTGQRAVSKWLKSIGEESGKWIGPSAAPHNIKGNIAPLLAGGAAGYGGYESGVGDPLTVGGLTGLGTWGLMNPRVLRAMQEAALGRARKRGGWPKGMTPQQAYDTGLTELTPQQHRSTMWTNEFLKGLAGKGLIVGGGAALTAAPGIVQNIERYTEAGAGAAENVEKQTAAPTMTTIKAPNGVEVTVPLSDFNKLVSEVSPDAPDPIAEGQDVEYDKFKKKWGPYVGKQLVLPAAKRSWTFEEKPGIIRAVADAAGEFQEVTSDAAEFTGEVLPQISRVLDPLPGAAADVSAGMKSQAEEAGKWREGVGTAINKAAPVGAGALGGYILSSLLGPGVKQDETPSERERRERLQRIYNLVATTGGGALGYYLSNRFGGGGDDAKTASDLGRAAAQQFSY